MRLFLCVLIASIGCGASPGRSVWDGVDAGAGEGGASTGGSGGDGGKGGEIGGGGAGGDGGRGGDSGGGGAGGSIIADAGKVSDGADGADAARPLEPICVRDGDPNAHYCDLVVTGEGLARFEGMLVVVRNGMAPFQRLGSGQTRVADGKFSITLPLVQEYVIIYKRTTVRFDMDGDGACSLGDEIFTSGATGFATDGGQQICPGVVSVNERSSLRAAFTEDCQPSPSFCELPDGGT